MEGTDLDFVGFRAKVLNQALAHFSSGGLGKCQAEDIAEVGIRMKADISNAEGKDFGFTGSGARDHHDGAINGFDSCAGWC